MPDPFAWTPAVQLIIGLCTLAGIAFTVWKWVLPRYRKARNVSTAFVDTFMGREAVVDSITGRVISPAIPAIGTRMADQESDVRGIRNDVGLLTRAVADLASAQADMTALQARMDDHDRRITDNDHRLTAIEQGHHLERMAGKAESIHMFRAIESIANGDDPDDAA